jgi:hypothetical protein
MSRIILSQSLIYDANDTPAPFFGLYMVAIKDRRIANYLTYPIEDQWHIYGTAGQEYLLAVSRNLAELLHIQHILKEFPRITEFFDIRVDTMVNYLEDVYDDDDDIDRYLGKIQVNNFYFETCCNARNVFEESVMIVPIVEARFRLENHINNPETYRGIRDMIVLNEVDTNMDDGDA